MEKKNPYVAAVLNFLLFGGGTIYVGKRVGLGVALMLGGLAAQAVEIKVSPVLDNSIPALWPFLLGGIVVMKLGLAVDGYREARAS